MNQKEIAEEMIDMLFLKKWRKRLKYDLIEEKRRNEKYFRYHNGEYIDKSIIKYKVNTMDFDDIYAILIKEGAKDQCFWMADGDSGILSTKEGFNRSLSGGMGAMLYLGNGIGFFQGEQYIGSPERYILVNNKKQGNPSLFR